MSFQLKTAHQDERQVLNGELYRPMGNGAGITGFMPAGEKLCIADFKIAFNKSGPKTRQNRFTPMNKRHFYFFPPTRLQNVYITTNQTSQSSYLFTHWGSDCFEFHHVLTFTLTESLMGFYKCGFVLRFIVCFRSIIQALVLWDNALSVCLVV